MENTEITSDYLVKLRHNHELIRADPAVILITVNLRRISSINRLAKEFYGRELNFPREKIKKYFSLVMKRWKKTRTNGNNDLGVLFYAESNMRKLHFRLISISLVKYGNAIYTRKTIDANDPLNRIFSIAGSVMREFAAKYYDLPKAELVFGHLGFSHPVYQSVKVSHPNNPSLDFIDMVRAHVWELGRHLFMNRVFEYRKIKQYVLLLLHEFKPYLNWVYSGGRQGRRSVTSHSVFELDKSLREIITQLKQDMGIFSTPQRVTRFVDNYDQSIKNSVNSLKEEFLEYYQGEKITKFVKDNFFEHAYDKYTETAKRYGTITHNYLAYGYSQPFSQKNVIYYGDYLILNNGPFLIVAELPIKSMNLSGKADIVFYKKVIYKDSKIYQPIMVLDIKTKYSAEWDYYGRHIRNRRNKIKPEVKIKFNEVSEYLWQNILFESLDFSIQQLDKYAEILRNDYINITHDYSINELIRGVIPVRGDIDKKTLKKELEILLNHLPQFITSLDEKTLENIFEDDEQYLFSLNKYMMDINNINLGVIFAKSDTESVREQLQPEIEMDRIHNEVPLAYNKNIVLYLTMASKGNAGETIAYVSAYIHLIMYLLEKNDRVAIIDTINVLDTFIGDRLRIFDREILDRIEIISIDKLEYSKIKYPVIIYGLDQLLIMNPSFDEMVLIEKIIAKQIFIVDTPKITAETSEVYKSHCLLPYYKTPRQSYVSEIWYNLPVIPQKLNKPISSTHRIVVIHDSENISNWMINIPYLQYIASQFSQSRNYELSSEVLIEFDVDDYTKLIEHTKDLLRYWYDKKVENIGKNNELINFVKLVPGNKIFSLRYNDFIVSDNKNKKNRINSKFITRKLSNPLEIYNPKSIELPDTSIFLREICEEVYGIEEETDEILLTQLKYKGNLDLTIIKDLKPSKRIFYNRHISGLSYNEFIEKSKWLDNLILSVWINLPHLKYKELEKLWFRFSSWLLFTIGYKIDPKYDMNIICNIVNIFKEMKLFGSRFKIDISALKIIANGFILELENESIFYFEELFSFLGVFKSPISIGRHYRLSSPDRIYERILEGGEPAKINSICIGLYDGDEYLFKYDNGWSLVGLIEYGLNYSEPWGLYFIEITDAVIDILPDIDPVEYDGSTIESRIQDEMEKYDIVEVNGETTINDVEDLRSFVRIKLFDKGDEVYNRQIYDFDKLIRILKKILHQYYHYRGKNYHLKYYNSMNWNDLSEFGNNLIKHKKLGYSSIDELYLEYLDYESVRKVTIHVGYDKGRCEQNCTFGNLEYSKIKNHYDDIKYSNSRYIRKVLRHDECYTLEIFDTEYSREEILYELGLDYKKSFKSDDFLDLFNRKSILIDGVKLLFEWEFDDDQVVYQEDYYMLILYRNVTKKFYLKEVLPMSHTLPEKYELQSLVYEPYIIYTYSRSLRTKEYHFTQISNTTSECLAMNEMGKILGNLEKYLPDHDFSDLDEVDIESITKYLRRKYHSHVENCEKEGLHIEDDGREYLTLNSIDYVKIRNRLVVNLTPDEGTRVLEVDTSVDEFVIKYTGLIEKAFNVICSSRPQKDGYEPSEIVSELISDCDGSQKQIEYEYKIDEMLENLVEVIKDLDETREYLDEYISKIHLYCEGSIDNQIHDIMNEILFEKNYDIAKIEEMDNMLISDEDYRDNIAAEFYKIVGESYEKQNTEIGLLEAIEYYQKAIFHFDIENDDRNQYNTFNLIGNISFKLRNYEFAFENYMRASEIAELHRYDKRITIKLSVNLANLLTVNERFEEAIVILEESLENANKYGFNHETKGKIHLNLAFAYRVVGKLRKSLYQYIACLENSKFQENFKNNIEEIIIEILNKSNLKVGNQDNMIKRLTEVMDLPPRYIDLLNEHIC